MRYESPQSKRVMIKSDPSGLIVLVKARVRLIHIVFGVVWLSIWIPFGLVGLGKLLKEGMPLFAKFIFLLWMGGWLLALALGVGALLWMVAGSERLVLDPQSLSRTIAVSIFSKTWNYDPIQVRNFRRNTRADKVLWSYIDNPFGKDGEVAFDYGQKTVYFGVAIDPAEADVIIEALKGRLGKKVQAA